MKLYLSSYRVPTPNDLIKLIGKDAADISVALVPNAKDYYAEKQRQLKIQDVVDDFMKIGLHADVVDLRDYSDAHKLYEKLSSYDLIWAAGGNTFMLRYEMRRSGFDVIAMDLVNKGVVYGGESAGALAAGNSLEGTEFADEPRFATELIFEGLALIDKFILPHVGDSPFGAGIDKTQEAHKNDPTLVELTDKQAYVVNGSEARVVTAI